MLVTPDNEDVLGEVLSQLDNDELNNLQSKNIRDIFGTLITFQEDIV